MSDGEPVELLKRSLELAKEQLKSVDEDIKRLTGRDFSDDRLPRRNLQKQSKINSYSQFEGLTRSYRTGDLSVSNRRGPSDKPPDDDIQVSIASSVVCVNDNRSRSEASKGMRKADKDRGRRMLGILQGTLNQFRAENAAAKPLLAKRREVDAKLEARAEKERELLRNERAKLFRNRREQQQEINLLQHKMIAVKKFEVWKEQMEKMIGFCRTETKPHIFFQPKSHTEESAIRVEQTTKAIKRLIERRRRKIDFDLGDLDSNFPRRSFFRNERKADDRDSNHENQMYSPSHGNSFEASGTPDNKRRRLSSVGTRVSENTTRLSDDGEVDDTFGLEGAEEPVLMDDEVTQHQLSHPSQPSKLKSVIVVKAGEDERSPVPNESTELTDSRTVHADQATDI